MKRPISLILSTALLLSLFAGCGKEPEPTQPMPTEPVQTTHPAETTMPTEHTVPTETTIPPETEAPDLQALRENLPVMDGSTSLIPLEAGLRAALFDISIEEATAQVSHTSSWSSFYNLLNGAADLVFSVPLSQMQWDTAAEWGVALETVPIAMEGFVFVVNAQNPVNSLTQAQIRDIYSGKITNWSEVGGLDEEIIPYQRNFDSGSQNYMIEFMGDTPLTDAPTELRPASMSGLMDVIAVNDNSRAAIGYSVYAYAADMYGNGNEIKFIRVDGVAPSKQSFADGTYPLLGCNYAIFHADQPADSHVRRFVDWILSDAGQYAVAQAGYVTIRDIGYDYTEARLEKYEGVGSGMDASGTVAPDVYLLTEVNHHVEDWGSYNSYSNHLTLTESSTAEGLPTWHITQLVDQRLEDEINQWIDAQMGWYTAGQAEMTQFVNQLNGNSSDSLYTEEWGDPMVCTVTIKNGYLTAVVALRFWKYGNSEQYKYYRTETAVWDLDTGRKLSTEELFYRGVDVDAVLNAYIQAYTQTTRDEFAGRPELLHDFVALPEDGWHLIPDGIYIDQGIAGFRTGEFIPFDWLPDGLLVTEIPRDFSPHLEDNGVIHVYHCPKLSTRDVHYRYYAEDRDNYVTLLKEDISPNAHRINEDLWNYVNTHFSTDVIVAYFEGLGFSREALDLMWLDWYGQVYANRYFLVTSERPYVYVPEDNSFVYYPQQAFLIYDLETGQSIHWSEIFREGWLEHSRMTCSLTDEPVETPWFDGLEEEWIVYDSMANLFAIRLLDGTQGYYLYIPAEYTNF